MADELTTQTNAAPATDAGAATPTQAVEVTNAATGPISEAKSQADVIARIDSELASRKGAQAAAAEGSTEPTDATGVADVRDGEEFPAEFVSAATALGMTNEQIQDTFSGLSNDDLAELLPLLVDEATPDISLASEVAPKPASEKEPEVAEKGELDALRDEVTKEVLAKLSPQLSKVATFEKEMRRRSAERVLKTTNDAFDKASEEFPVFGNTKTLPVFPAGPKKGQIVPVGPAYKARAEVFEVANALMKAGRTAEDAVGDAIAWYRGKHGQQQVQRNLIKTLQSKERVLSGMRSAKETKQTFASKRDEGIAFVENLIASKGVKK